MEDKLESKLKIVGVIIGSFALGLMIGFLSTFFIGVLTAYAIGINSIEFTGKYFLNVCPYTMWPSAVITSFLLTRHYLRTRQN